MPVEEDASSEALEAIAAARLGGLSQRVRELLRAVPADGAIAGGRDAAVPHIRSALGRRSPPASLP